MRIRVLVSAIDLAGSQRPKLRGLRACGPAGLRDSGVFYSGCLQDDDVLFCFVEITRVDTLLKSFMRKNRYIALGLIIRLRLMIFIREMKPHNHIICTIIRVHY